jgi:NAD(P)-dependent dehydrogenase (short-subunit alcohol dehydrogenase family)
MSDSLPHLMVVGASSGIGECVARHFAGTHKVTALARRAERIAALEQLGVEAVLCDVTDLDAFDQAIQAAVGRHGRLHAAVYCAGLQQIKPLRALKASDIQAVLSVNLVAPMLLVRAMASQRVSEPKAVFCAVSSVAGQRPEPGIIAYSVAKAGLDALIKGAAKELGPRRAVGVAPGWLDTEMTQAYRHVYGEEFRDALGKRSPAGIATVDSVVELIAFLLSDRARHITGQIVTVDGGAIL